MASSVKLFRSKSPAFEGGNALEPVKSGSGFAKAVDKSAAPEFSLSSGGKVLHVSPKEIQRLKVLGCSPEYIKDLMHTVSVLESYSSRQIDPSIYEDIKRRYHLGMGTMASIVAMSNLKLSDRGVDLRGLARFYSRNRADIGDVDQLEKFVNWVKARGEPVTGVPSAWRHFASLTGTRRARRPQRRSSVKTTRAGKLKASNKKSGSRRGKSKRAGKR